jgi:intraflagellar transport protein 46
VKDLFDYITRYKPQKIDLDTKIKPFVPEYIPCVGEVDSYLKMNKPDGTKEDLGVNVLDEPSLNHEDKTVLEMKYIQEKNVQKPALMNVESIEGAEKKPKDVSRWIKNVEDLHKTRPPPTVNYSK